MLNFYRKISLKRATEIVRILLMQWATATLIQHGFGPMMKQFANVRAAGPPR